MEQWQAYNDSASVGGQRRYNGNTAASSQMSSPRDFGASAPTQNPAQQPPAGFKYDNYQGGLNPHQTPSSATSPMASPNLRDGNGDVPMQDSHDAYAGLSNSAKYPMRPHHQHHLSTGRAANLQQEPSAAAQRYSPMEVLSPTSPYGSKTGSAGQFTQQPPPRQSPTRSSDYAPQQQQSPYYSTTRQGAPQLPPLNPYGSGQESYSPSTLTPMDSSYMDPKSPKRAPLQSAPPLMQQDRGPVPEFKRLRALTELKPKVNGQPPFRRANPEGGFISVSNCHVPAALILLRVADPCPCCDSPSKRSQCTSRPPTESATPASNTSRRVIPAVC
jgi:dual specificity protein kinase YAK1